VLTLREQEQVKSLRQSLPMRSSGGGRIRRDKLEIMTTNAVHSD
jgi:hypothetical protein